MNEGSNGSNSGAGRESVAEVSKAFFLMENHLPVALALALIVFSLFHDYKKKYIFLIRV